MADLFNGMYFVNKFFPEPPKKPTVARRRKSEGEQCLAEYLNAHRSNGEVDKEWKKVHDKGTGKKQFRKLVQKQILLSRMAKLGKRDRRKSVAPKYTARASIATEFLSEADKKKLALVAAENEEKRNQRELYLKEISGRNLDDGDEISVRGRRRHKKNKKKDSDSRSSSSRGSTPSSLNETRRLSENMPDLSFSIKEETESDAKESDDDQKDVYKLKEDIHNDTQQIKEIDTKLENSEEIGVDEEDNNASNKENTPEIDSDEQAVENLEAELTIDKESEEEEVKTEVEPIEDNDTGIGEPEAAREVAKNLIPAPANVPLASEKRNSFNGKNNSKTPQGSPRRQAGRSPRTPRKVGPSTSGPLRSNRNLSPGDGPKQRSLARSRSPSPAANKTGGSRSPMRTPRKSSLNDPKKSPMKKLPAPASPRRPAKEATTPRKKSLTIPKDPFTPRSPRRSKPGEQSKSDAKKSSVGRTGAGAPSPRPLDRSPSRNRKASLDAPKSPARQNKNVRGQPARGSFRGPPGDKGEPKEHKNYGTARI